MSHVRERVVLECVCLCTCVFVCVGGSDGGVNVYRYKKTCAFLCAPGCTILVYNRAFTPQESRAKSRWKSLKELSERGKLSRLPVERGDGFNINV